MISLSTWNDFTATADIQNGQAFSTDSTTSWNWAQQICSTFWELIGLRGADFSSVAHLNYHSVIITSDITIPNLVGFLDFGRTKPVNKIGTERRKMHQQAKHD